MISEHQQEEEEEEEEEGIGKNRFVVVTKKKTEEEEEEEEEEEGKNFLTFLKRRHKRTPLFCTHKKRRRRRRERLSRSAHIRVPLPPHNHFCELDGRARIASSKGERFEPRENAEHTRRLEETREVSRPKNHQSHPSSRHFSKRRRRHQSVCNRKHL